MCTWLGETRFRKINGDQKWILISFNITEIAWSNSIVLLLVRFLISSFVTYTSFWNDLIPLSSEINKCDRKTINNIQIIFVSFNDTLTGKRHQPQLEGSICSVFHDDAVYHTSSAFPIRTRNKPRRASSGFASISEVWSRFSVLWNVGRISMTAAKRPFRHQPAALNPRQATHAGMHRHDGTVFVYFIPFIGLYRPLLAFNSEVSSLWSRKPVLGLVCVCGCICCTTVVNDTTLQARRSLISLHQTKPLHLPWLHLSVCHMTDMLNRDVEGWTVTMLILSITWWMYLASISDKWMELMQTFAFHSNNPFSVYKRPYKNLLKYFSGVIVHWLTWCSVTEKWPMRYRVVFQKLPDVCPSLLDWG